MAKKRTIAALLSAFLLSLPWVGLGGYTLFVGLIPLLYISHSYERGRNQFWRTFGYTALALGVWSAITTWWIWYAAPIGAVLSVLITVGLFGGVFMLYHYVSKRAPKPLAYTLLVAGWIAAEYLYTVGEVSFPWLVLGNGFSGSVKLVQWYDTLGVFGGTLWVWVVNIAIWEFVQKRSKGRLTIALALLILPIAASLIRYYTYTEEGKEIKVSVVQPNIDPYEEKFLVAQEQQVELLLQLAEEAPVDVDFILMPESAIDQGLWESDNQLNHNPTIGRFRTTIESHFPQAQIITGAMTLYRYAPQETPRSTSRTASTIDYHYDVFNTALSIDTTQSVGRHHKSKLVVGVEKMPYVSNWKFLENLIVDLGGTTGQLGVDEVCLPLSNAEGFRYGTPICYEAVYGETTAEFVKHGGEALFIISNDGWWDDTNGHRHLFKFSRLRAIETRRSVARSANTGTSGFINQRGDIVESLGWDIQAVITQTITSNNHQTLYVRFGDLVARISVLTFLLSLGYYVAVVYRKRNLSEKL